MPWRSSNFLTRARYCALPGAVLPKAAEWVAALLLEHTAATIFLSQIIRAALVPVPTPSLLMLAGALIVPPGAGLSAALGRLTGLVALPAALGACIGSAFPFFISYWSGEFILEQSHYFLRLKKSLLIRVEQRMASHAPSSVFILRLLPFVPLAVGSVLAGALGVPAEEFFIWTFLGTIPRSLMLAALGYFTRGTLDKILLKVHRFDIRMLSALCATAVLAAYISMKRKKAGRLRPPIAR